jgi:hypothetical protein
MAQAVANAARVVAVEALAECWVPQSPRRGLVYFLAEFLFLRRLGAIVRAINLG